MCRICKQAAVLVGCGMFVMFAGCGGGGDDEESASNNSPQSSNQNPTSNSELAPASIGNRVINGHIGGTSTIWQIVTTGGTTGTFTYGENGKHLNDGSYTWTKTSASSGDLTLSPDNNVMELDYTAPKQGTYVFHANANYNETGTFTTN